MQETWVRSLGWEDPLEKGMSTQSSILVRRILRTEDPRGIQSMRLQRVGHGNQPLSPSTHPSQQSLYCGREILQIESYFKILLWHHLRTTCQRKLEADTLISLLAVTLQWFCFQSLLCQFGLTATSLWFLFRTLYTAFKMYLFSSVSF